MERKFLNIFIIIALIAMSLTVVGCTTKEEPKEEPKQETSENKEVDTKRETVRVRAAARLAEEKLNIIFEAYTPADSDEVIMVGKERYTTLDEVKNFLKEFYTEEMVNQLVDKYVQVKDVPGKGNITTLNLPEDYITIVGYSFTEADKITVNNEEATILINVDGKKVTYELIKANDNWLIKSKTVE